MLGVTLVIHKSESDGIVITTTEVETPSWGIGTVPIITSVTQHTLETLKDFQTRTAHLLQRPDTIKIIGTDEHCEQKVRIEDILGDKLMNIIGDDYGLRLFIQGSFTRENPRRPEDAEKLNEILCGKPNPGETEIDPEALGRSYAGWQKEKAYFGGRGLSKFIGIKPQSVCVLDRILRNPSMREKFGHAFCAEYRNGNMCIKLLEGVPNPPFSDVMGCFLRDKRAQNTREEPTIVVVEKAFHLRQKT